MAETETDIAVREIVFELSNIKELLIKINTNLEEIKYQASK